MCSFIYLFICWVLEQLVGWGFAKSWIGNSVDYILLYKLAFDLKTKFERFSVIKIIDWTVVRNFVHGLCSKTSSAAPQSFRLCFIVVVFFFFVLQFRKILYAFMLYLLSDCFSYSFVSSDCCIISNCSLHQIWALEIVSEELRISTLQPCFQFQI